MRPTDYTPELAETICKRIASNISLRKIVQDKEMPCIQTIYTWLDKHKEFLEQYRIAREIQHDIQAEEVRDLPYECEALGLEAAYTKLKMDGSKWAASKGNPTKYGDKITHAGDEKSPLIINITRFSDAGNNASE